MANKRGRKPKQDKETNVSGDTQTNKETLELSGDTQTTDTVTTTNKPKQVTKKETKQVKYMAVVRLVKGKQLHTSRIYKDKESLKRWMSKLNLIDSQIIEVNI
jgi:hypothetical protein